MGKKSAPPPGPDWKQVLEQSKEYQDRTLSMMGDYQDFQEKAYGEQKAINDQIAGIQLPAMEDEAALAKQQRDRYRDYIPQEDEFIDELMTWDNKVRRDERAGAAQAGINAASDAQREAQLRQLEGYGIDPSQTRSAALDSNLRLQQAVTAAGAGNAQRQAVEQEGIAYGGQGVNLMRGIPSMSQANLSAATGAGQTAMGNQGALGAFGGQGYMNASNMNNQGFNQMNQGYNTAGNMYGNQLKAYEMEQANDPMKGIGGLIGTGLSAYATGGLSLFGAEGGPIPHAAEGGSPAPQGGQAPGSAGQTPGGHYGAVATGQYDKGEYSAAPRPASQGIPSDSTPVMTTPGEFIIPDDVARWVGEKKLQEYINKGREERVATETQRAQNQQALGIPA